MNVTIEEKKIEAIRRMRKLGLYIDTIRQFKEQGLVSRSEPPYGAFYWVEGEELDDIRKFEAEYDALVYCVVRAYTEFGVLDAYLYVSDHPDEWDIDDRDLDDNCAMAYVVNIDNPDFSEFGSVGLASTVAAGLIRTW